jgi:hypothetical protein
MNPDSPVDASIPSRPNWRMLLRGIEVRLRFAAALALLAALMAGWPWLRVGWERLTAHWGGHGKRDAVSADIEFFCPMDPGVVSAWPAICPICNMDLIQRKKSDAILLPEGVLARMQLSPYRIQLAGIRTVPVKVREQSESGASHAKLSVPASAIVRHGDRAIVYVETMPGMFDALPVTLGPQEDDEYLVVEGLQPGQLVAATGAFLIDAETRLNPSLATQYFGASRQLDSHRMPTLPQRSGANDPLAGVSAEERALIERQRVCPVTDADLGSMGRPIAVVIRGRRIFLCCKGCEAALRNNPEKFLHKLASNSPSQEP